jgi:hypothetical protein
LERSVVFRLQPSAIADLSDADPPFAFRFLDIDRLAQRPADKRCEWMACQRQLSINLAKPDYASVLNFELR